MIRLHRCVMVSTEACSYVPPILGILVVWGPKWPRFWGVCPFSVMFILRILPIWNFVIMTCSLDFWCCNYRDRWPISKSRICPSLCRKNLCATPSFSLGIYFGFGIRFLPSCKVSQWEICLRWLRFFAPPWPFLCGCPLIYLLEICENVWEILCTISRDSPPTFLSQSASTFSLR